jgi:calcium-activated chloride channel regulator 4
VSHLIVSAGRLLVPRTGEPCSINSNGYPELACRYIDDREATGYTGSLMYKQFLPRITSFCEKESNGVSQANAHNPDAPNLQNVRCDRKSVWEVMLEHQDFAALKEENDVRTPRADDELVPSVKLVKKRSIRLVLVLDISGSMKGQRLTQLRQAAELLISQILEDGQQLGIVTFAATASIRSHLRDINPSNREVLLASVPISATGATSIGSGILDGIRVLKGRDNDHVAAGGQLLVITDGLENRAPYINDTIPEVGAHCSRYAG